MERQVRDLVGAAGVRPGDIRVDYRVAARHVGQGFEIEVDLPAPEAWTSETIEERFRERYASIRGNVVLGVAVEVTTWRVVGSADTLTLERYARPSDHGDPHKGERRIFCQDVESSTVVPVYDRHRLEPGWSSSGPLIIEERESTLVVPVASEVAVTAGGSITVTGY